MVNDGLRGPAFHAPRGRGQHHLPVQHHVRDAAVERSRPGADPLGDLRRRRKHADLRSLARHRRGVRVRRRRSAADADEVPRTAGGAAPDQRGRRQHPRRGRRFARPQHDRFRDRSLACLDHEQRTDRRDGGELGSWRDDIAPAARGNAEISSRAADAAGHAARTGICRLPPSRRPRPQSSRRSRSGRASCGGRCRRSRSAPNNPAPLPSRYRQTYTRTTLARRKSRCRPARASRPWRWRRRNPRSSPSTTASGRCARRSWRSARNAAPAPRRPAECTSARRS